MRVFSSKKCKQTHTNMRTSLLHHMKRDPIQVDLHQMTSHPKQGVLVPFKLVKIQINPLIVELLPYRSCMCIKSPKFKPYSQRFRTWEMTHIRRKGNQPAHQLARFSKDKDSCITWVNECPSFIEHNVARYVPHTFSS